MTIAYALIVCKYLTILEKIFLHLLGKRKTLINVQSSVWIFEFNSIIVIKLYQHPCQVFCYVYKLLQDDLT